MDTHFTICNLRTKLIIDEFEINLSTLSVVQIDLHRDLHLEEKVWTVNGIICHLHPNDFELLFDKLGEKDVDYISYYHEEARRSAIGIRNMPFLFLKGFPQPDEDLKSCSKMNFNR